MRSETVKFSSRITGNGSRLRDLMSSGVIVWLTVRKSLREALNDFANSTNWRKI